MSFDSVAGALLSVVRLSESYDARNSSRYDYGVLRRGVKRALVLQYGGTAERRVVQSPRRVHTSWLVNMELFVPYRSLDSVGKEVTEEVQALLDHMDRYPTLNGAAEVVNAFVDSASEAVPWQGNTRWWVVTLQCRVDERATVTIAE
ncbi:MAG: hypothetical protein L0177_11840 [Chloroflexi bacterium]|nr:hypothetical protein [Chloroflexota bacterium]